MYLISKPYPNYAMRTSAGKKLKLETSANEENWVIKNGSGEILAFKRIKMDEICPFNDYVWNVKIN
jgi:hypothetical protein